MYSIRLSDGTMIEGLTASGNYFVSDERVTDRLTGKLHGVNIICTEPEEYAMIQTGEHEHMKLEHEMTRDGKYMFLLLDVSKAEIEKARLEANIEYLAMMTGVEL